MKSRSSTYLLIVAVAGIWGTVIYKVVSGINPDAPEVTNIQSVGEFNPQPIAKSESFAISEVERDPFLGTLQKKNSSKKRTTRKKTSSETTLMPSINYAGIVKNGKNQVFILTINGKQYLMRKGQTIDDVKLVSGTSKKVKIRFNNSNSTIIVD